MARLPELRAEAEALSRRLPGLALQSGASEAIHVGSAGRRRAGSGEDFWQYRRYAQEDAASRIDWRRSAKSDDHFVRETELETARTVLFWLDPDAGFDWKSENARRTKAEEATVMMLAIAIMLSRDGERIGVLGADRKPSFGKRAVDRLSEDLLSCRRDPFPTPPRQRATLIIASDFYEPLSTWESRLSVLAVASREGVALSVSDPIESDFPYQGRVRFARPGASESLTIGRSESIRGDYLEAVKKQRIGLRDLAQSKLGWRLVEHATNKSTLNGAAALKDAVESLGARR